MTQEKKITLKGISRTPYEFEVHPSDTKFKTLSAVYAVLKRNPPGYSIIYISHTSDMSACFNREDVRDCLDKEGKTHVAILSEPVVSRRISIQTDLVASYMPVCNSAEYGIEEDRRCYKVTKQETFEMPSMSSCSDKRRRFTDTTSVARTSQA